VREARHSTIAGVMSALIAGCLVAGAWLSANPVGAAGQAEDEMADASAAAAAEGEDSTAIGTDRVGEGFEAMGWRAVPENVIRTLSTLERVSDYPIYTMHYFGPYIRASELEVQCGAQAARSEERPIWACSLFAAVGNADAPMFGRNFDWEHSPLLVAFLEPETGYRSVVSVDLAYLFDEETLGRLDTATVEELLPLLDAPFLTFDGMNEVGLAIGMASVGYECGYPSGGDRRDVGDLRLMREVLESSATVEEAIAFLKGINPVSQGGPNTHYVVADCTPAAALIEYHAGEMYVFRSSAESPWQLGTNFPVVLTNGSPLGRCWRYDLLAETLREEGGVLSSQDAMALLQSVSTRLTQWSIVYDLAKGIMSLCVGRGYQDVFSVSLFEEIPTP